MGCSQNCSQLLSLSRVRTCVRIPTPGRAFFIYDNIGHELFILRYPKDPDILIPQTLLALKEVQYVRKHRARVRPYRRFQTFRKLAF